MLLPISISNNIVKEFVLLKCVIYEGCIVLYNLYSIVLEATLSFRRLEMLTYKPYILFAV